MSHEIQGRLARKSDVERQSRIVEEVGIEVAAAHANRAVDNRRLIPVKMGREAESNAHQTQPQRPERDGQRRQQPPV